MVAAGAQLGRLHAEQLLTLAQLSEHHGDGNLRLTPWQGVLLPDVPAARGAEAQRALADLGLLVDPAAPLARLIACSGSPGCARALADTKADARRLAALLPPAAGAADIHLSGCPRRCAAAHGAAFTLLATAPARYQLLAGGHGPVLAEHLNIEQAAARLAAPCPEFPA